MCLSYVHINFLVPHTIFCTIIFNIPTDKYSFFQFTAAQAAGTIFILSTISTSSIEEVAIAAPEGIKWFQLYIYSDRNVTLNLIKRAEHAGFKALVLTVDAPLFGDRRADMRNKFALPSHLRYVLNFSHKLDR